MSEDIKLLTFSGLTFIEFSTSTASSGAASKFLGISALTPNVMSDRTDSKLLFNLIFSSKSKY